MLLDSNGPLVLGAKQSESIKLTTQLGVILTSNNDHFINSFGIINDAWFRLGE